MGRMGRNRIVREEEIDQKRGKEENR